MYLGDRYVQKEKGSCSSDDQVVGDECHSQFIHYDEENRLWRTTNSAGGAELVQLSKEEEKKEEGDDAK